MKFKENQYVVCIRNDWEEKCLLIDQIRKLEVGKQYQVGVIGKWDFTAKKQEEAINLIGSGWGGWYPACLFVSASEYKPSLIGDNIYEIY